MSGALAWRILARIRPKQFCGKRKRCAPCGNINCERHGADLNTVDIFEINALRTPGIIAFDQKSSVSFASFQSSWLASIDKDFAKQVFKEAETAVKEIARLFTSQLRCRDDALRCGLGGMSGQSCAEDLSGRLPSVDDDRRRR